MNSVPKLWPGETIVCIGTGPSLTQADVDLVRGRARVIAVNEAYRLAPWADVLYSSDQLWWPRQQGAPAFGGLKFGISPRKGMKPATFGRCPDVKILLNTGPLGLEQQPIGLRHGQNSGYAAINLAVHLGATRIILLGYNLGKVGRAMHFNGTPGSGASYDKFARNYATMVDPLKQFGVEVINCTQPTRLTCFRRADLRDVLVDQKVAA